MSTRTNLIKQIPNAINLRINTLSSCKKILKIIKELILKPCIIVVSISNSSTWTKKVNLTKWDNTMNKSNTSKNINYGKGEINNNNKHNANNNSDVVNPPWSMHLVPPGNFHWHSIPRLCLPIRDNYYHAPHCVF